MRMPLPTRINRRAMCLADGELPVDLPEVTLTLEEGQEGLFIAQVLNQAGLS